MSLPLPNWTFIESLQLNDMFVMDMDDCEYERVISNNDYEEIGKHIYRVQKLSTRDYFFRFHTDTTTEISKEASLSKKYIRVRTPKAFFEQSPHKIKISLLGKIFNA